MLLIVSNKLLTANSWGRKWEDGIPAGLETQEEHKQKGGKGRPEWSRKVKSLPHGGDTVPGSQVKLEASSESAPVKGLKLKVIL